MRHPGSWELGDFTLHALLLLRLASQKLALLLGLGCGHVGGRRYRPPGNICPRKGRRQRVSEPKAPVAVGTQRSRMAREDVHMPGGAGFNSSHLGQSDTQRSAVQGDPGRGAVAGGKVEHTPGRHHRCSSATRTSRSLPVGPAAGVWHSERPPGKAQSRGGPACSSCSAFRVWT